MNFADTHSKFFYEKGFWAVFRRGVLQIVRRPIYWCGFLLIPLLMIFMLTSLMSEGLPIKAPAAIVDKDGTSMSRQITQTLQGMQMVDLCESCNSYTEGRKLIQEGKIYGFFIIPENFQADLLAGRQPEITFYTNMAFYVPASLLFKTFKTTALYTKAGVAVLLYDAVGAESMGDATSLLMPVQIQTRGIGNPGLNYAIYLCNSFVPCCLQLMIFLVTCFSLGQEVKYKTSPRLMRLAGNNVYRAVFAKLLPQTIIWIVIAVFMESWLFRWNNYPMHGSWVWMTLSEMMFVLACQGFAIFIYGIIPNLRMSLSVGALLGVLAFSIAAFSFPVESMYPSIGIFSWIYPTRYNFMIYINEALNGIDIYYSRLWFVAYIVFMILPFTVMWRIGKEFRKPVYAP